MHPRWMTWAGVSAVVGGVLAVLLTFPFATAYFRAYPGFDAIPAWLPVIQRAIRPIMSFGAPIVVYNTFGRVYNLVYLLLLPSTVALHRVHRDANSGLEKWGYRLTILGLIAAAIGVAGDYWANGLGFPLEVVGIIVLSLGSTANGIALLRIRTWPAWSSWLLILCLPGCFIFVALIGHVPSGPTLQVAVAYLGAGFALINRSVKSTDVDDLRAA